MYRTGNCVHIQIIKITYTLRQLEAVPNEKPLAEAVMAQVYYVYVYPLHG